MPRGSRLDSPGALHHVMARGIERRLLFRDDVDRDDFVGRLAGLAAARAFTVYGWAVLPNHFHLLVRTDQRPLARTMRSLLTGYAGAFNRRHRRSGHLLQNRYKSIVCEEEPYFLELVRYLHLNPLRAKVVPDLRALAHYPYSGHAALLGIWPRPWQETHEVLSRFSAQVARARVQYQAFVAEGVAKGGGLTSKEGVWCGVWVAGRQCGSYATDESGIRGMNASWGGVSLSSGSDGNSKRSNLSARPCVLSRWRQRRWCGVSVIGQESA